MSGVFLYKIWNVTLCAWNHFIFVQSCFPGGFGSRVCQCYNRNLYSDSLFVSKLKLFIAPVAPPNSNSSDNWPTTQNPTDFVDESFLANRSLVWRGRTVFWSLIYISWYLPLTYFQKLFKIQLYLQRLWTGTGHKIRTSTNIQNRTYKIEHLRTSQIEPNLLTTSSTELFHRGEGAPVHRVCVAIM